ncbi:MAG: FtsW/RodA/SpoVE family cell cycle protein, partial [Clostridia bacterium]|nr:FtsW/RodA/SpoVE family cell cycle protein [Clostridia bacterium]
LLVVITGDMGSALVFLMIFAVMMFMAGIKLRYFAIAILTVVAAFPIVWVKVFNDIQRDRFLALFYPESYSDIIYQQLQGKNAIGSGRFTGQGLFQGPYTQNGVVPEAENDMILSVFGEELGFLGCLAVIVLFLLMVFRVIKTAQMSNDNPGKMMCIGVAAMIASQVIVNVGMCLMLLPCIGITLPFMSAGGSSNLCIYIAMGVVFSVYRVNCDRTPTDFRMINVRTPYR